MLQSLRKRRYANVHVAESWGDTVRPYLYVSDTNSFRGEDKLLAK